MTRFHHVIPKIFRQRDILRQLVFIQYNCIEYNFSISLLLLQVNSNHETNDCNPLESPFYRILASTQLFIVLFFSKNFRKIILV